MIFFLKELRKVLLRFLLSKDVKKVRDPASWLSGRLTFRSEEIVNPTILRQAQLGQCD